MLAAVLSDIHDNVNNMLAALAIAEEQGCRALIFTGDMADFSTFSLLREAWPHELHLVFGNNEYEHEEFYKLAERSHHTHLYGRTGEFRLDNRLIFITHYPHIATRALETGSYDAIFYGHSHIAESKLVGRTLTANPGEVCGIRYSPSFAVYDTVTNTIKYTFL